MTKKDAFSDEFRDRLIATFEQAGWDRSRFAGPLTFTRPIGNGFQAVLSVTGSAGSHPAPPTFAEAWAGIGYEPATALMPRLALRPEPLQVLTGEDESENFPGSELGSEEDLVRFRDRVVEPAGHACRSSRPALTHCEAWLRPVHADAYTETDLFIGEHRVGRLDGPAAELFSPALAAAARYQELPLVRAELLWSAEESGRSLAVARPGSVPRPPF